MYHSDVDCYFRLFRYYSWIYYQFALFWSYSWNDLFPHRTCYIILKEFREILRLFEEADISIIGWSLNSEGDFILRLVIEGLLLRVFWAKNVSNYRRSLYGEDVKRLSLKTKFEFVKEFSRESKLKKKSFNR